jgi:hypothetical protein
MALEDIRRGLDVGAIPGMWLGFGIAWREARMSQPGFREIRSANQVGHSGVAAHRSSQSEAASRDALDTYHHTAICFSLTHAARPLESQEASKRTVNECSETACRHVRISDCAALQLRTK